MQNQLQASEGELSMTIQVKRAATGITEEYHLKSLATPAQAEAVRHIVKPVVHEASGALQAEVAELRQP